MTSSVSISTCTTSRGDPILTCIPLPTVTCIESRGTTCWRSWISTLALQTTSGGTWRLHSTLEMYVSWCLNMLRCHTETSLPLKYTVPDSEAFYINICFFLWSPGWSSSTHNNNWWFWWWLWISAQAKAQNPFLGLQNKARWDSN